MSVKTICTKNLVCLVYYKSSRHANICSFVVIVMTHHTWSAPFTCTISGPTGSGKSVFVQRLLKHAKTVIEPRPERILYCYGVYQTIFSQFEGVEFNEGLPSLDEFKGERHSLVIIDDLMHETNDVVDRKSTRLNSSHVRISYAVFCLKHNS